MDSSSIVCFLSAARTGNFSAAARELSMTRQAVSKNIQDLEHELGYPLFFHKSAPLVLTTAGKKMLSYYIDQERDLAVANRIFGTTDSGKPGLQVAWGRWLMPGSTLIDAMADFNIKSGIKLGVVSGTEWQALESLRTGEADVAFLSRYVCSMLREPYTAMILKEYPIGMVAPAQLLTQDPDSIARNMPYLACPAGEDTESEILGRVQRALRYFKTPPTEILIQPNMETILLQIALGNGFSCMPNVSGRNINLQVLKMPPRDQHNCSVSLCMVWLNRNQNRNILALRDWIQNNKRTLP